MFLRILRNDFKRKKVMNIVLFIFICISSLLLSSSFSVLYQSINSIPLFQEKSNTADYNFIIPYQSSAFQEIDAWVAEEEQVTAYDLLEAITLPKGHAFANGEDISNGNGTALMKQSMHVNYVFDEAGNRITLEKNEIAIPAFMNNTLSLQPGDAIELDLYGRKKQFIFKTFIKDGFLGNAMIGNSRMIINDEDFDELNIGLSDEQKTMMLMSNCKEGYNLIDAYINKGFPSYLALHKETISVAFLGASVSLSMMLMLASTIFIVIAAMTLRFAIVTTLNEEHREIGIMKAIGLEHQRIRNIYIARYLGHAIFGCGVGFLLGIPLTNLFNSMNEQLVVVETSTFEILLAFLVSIGVAVFIILIALLVLRKLHACSAMKAIRGGQGDERFKKDRFPLYKQSRGSMVNLLSIHDVIQKFKPYLVLMMIIILSYMLMVIPSSLKEVLKGKQMMDILGFSVADVYSESNLTVMSVAEAEAKRLDVEQEMHAFDSTISVYAQYTDTMQIKHDSEYISVLADKQAVYRSDDTYVRGVGPKLASEIAISEVISEKVDKHVGDHMTLIANGKQEDFIISGIFSAMYNTGNSIRLGEAYELEKVTFSQHAIYVNTPDKEAVIEEILQSDSSYHYQDAEGVIATYTSGFTSYMDISIAMLMGMILIILMLITILFTRLQVLQQKSEIAIMKSIGIASHQIRSWQIRRIMIVVVVSLIPAILLFMNFNVAIFNAMSAVMGIQKLGFRINEMIVDVKIAYLLCPLMICAVVYFFARFSTRQITHIQINEMKED